MEDHHAEVRISTKELEQLSVEEVHQKCDEAAREMAQQATQSFLQTLTQAATEVGNVGHFKGRPTVDDLFHLYETVWIDFDDYGNPELPTVLCGPELMEHFQRLKSEIESDSHLKEKFADLLTRKREEWRDREASRKLVG